MKTLRVTISLVLLLSLTASGLFLQNAGANQAFAMNDLPAGFYNPLLLNNRPLEYNLFTITSGGVLSVVAGNPIKADAPRIPFRIYLQRDGKPIHTGASDTSRVVSAIEVSIVLAHAQPGDVLVIDPVRKEDQVPRQLIRLASVTLNTQFNLLPFLRKQEDNC